MTSVAAEILLVEMLAVAAVLVVATIWMDCRISAANTQSLS